MRNGLRFTIYRDRIMVTETRIIHPLMRSSIEEDLPDEHRVESLSFQVKSMVHDREGYRLELSGEGHSLVVSMDEVSCAQVFLNMAGRILPVLEQKDSLFTVVLRRAGKTVFAALGLNELFRVHTGGWFHFFGSLSAMWLLICLFTIAWTQTRQSTVTIRSCQVVAVLVVILAVNSWFGFFTVPGRLQHIGKYGVLGLYMWTVFAGVLYLICRLNDKVMKRTNDLRYERKKDKGNMDEK